MRSLRTDVLVVALVAIIASLAGPVARADDRVEEDRPFARNGYYAGLSGGYPAGAFAVDDDDEGLGGDMILGYSGSLRVGRRLHPYFGVEGIGEMTYGKGVVSTLFGADDDLVATAFTVNGKLYMLTGRFQPYASLGMGGGAAVVYPDDSNGKDSFGYFLGRAGLGFDVYVTENVAVEVEASGGIGAGPDDERYVQFTPSLGLAYRF